MNLLVLNAGSSSLKFAAWIGGRLVCRGQVEQIGGASRLHINRRVQKIKAPTSTVALRVIASELERQKFVPSVVAHRVVHGGPKFSQPIRVTAAVERALASYTPLAPLHVPRNLQVLRAGRQRWPQAEVWAAFDTGLFHELPAAARNYALPIAVTKKFNIRKYGFHGISHAWALEQAAKRLKIPRSARTMITIHLGAGDSMTLWKHGHPVDTSMGFTPLEGLTMATRSGDIDPMIPLFLQTQAKLSVQQVTKMLNHQSGLYGLTGLHDIRDVLGAAGHAVPGWPRRRWSAQQRRQSRLAIDIFRYDIQRYLSSYVGLAQHLRAIVFTGSVGQNRVVQRLILRGVNVPRGVKCLTVATDEERAIAEDLQRVIH